MQDVPTNTNLHTQLEIFIFDNQFQKDDVVDPMIFPNVNTNADLDCLSKHIIKVYTPFD